MGRRACAASRAFSRAGHSIRLVGHHRQQVVGGVLSLTGSLENRALVVAERGQPVQIGRAHVLTPVTNAHMGCRLLLEKTHSTICNIFHITDNEGLVVPDYDELLLICLNGAPHLLEQHYMST